MHDDTALIALVAMGFVLACAFGFLATRVRLPPIVGYLLAGVAVGPFTSGFVGDAQIASQLAEIGVMLLMFGVGLHFSLDTLQAMKNIAIPGAIAQIGVATAIGTGLAVFWAGTSGRGWCWGSRSPWPARWCCCAPSNSGTSWTHRTGASPSGGSSSRIW